MGGKDGVICDGKFRLDDDNTLSIVYLHSATSKEEESSWNTDLKDLGQPAIEESFLPTVLRLMQLGSPE